MVGCEPFEKSRPELHVERRLAACLRSPGRYSDPLLPLIRFGVRLRDARRARAAKASGREPRVAFSEAGVSPGEGELHMSDSIAHTPRRRRLLVGAAGALVLMSGPLLAALFVTVLGGASTA